MITGGHCATLNFRSIKKGYSKKQDSVVELLHSFRIIIL